ncbi:hypothetical protein AB6A40_007148 [Gnathostoma spinigerum]|uniref:Uncharacterized protein n=1 Tax=Gnathostoma spinigerum TaxID=75299 RepID=A0ABD6EQI6_9BILA
MQYKPMITARRHRQQHISQCESWACNMTSDLGCNGISVMKRKEGRKWSPRDDSVDHSDISGRPLYVDNLGPAIRSHRNVVRCEKEDVMKAEKK